MAIKGSLSDEEEEDARSASSDDQEPMNPYLYKQVKKMNKCLKEINSTGYMVFLKDGPHNKKFKKNKQKKEKKPKHESYAVFGEWVSGDEESSASSSDESNKKLVASNFQLVHAR